MAAFSGWQVAVLKSIGAPVTQNNLRFLNAWQRAEGGSASFNPLNTTQPAKGAGNYNSVGVKNFRSTQQGVRATAQTLTNGRYKDIVQLLRSGMATPQQLGTAVAHSPWGTGSGVLRVLGSKAAALPDVPKNSRHTGIASPDTAGAPDMKMAFINHLMESSQRNVSGESPDMGGLMALAQQRKQLQAAAQLIGPEPGVGARVPSVGGKVTVAGGTGLTELFYDPLGGIKNGRQIGAIGHHGDHVHIAAGSQRAQLLALQQAKRMGLSVREDGITDSVDPVHTTNSYHYRKFNNKSNLRQGADVSGSPKQMAAYYRWAAATFNKGRRR